MMRWAQVWAVGLAATLAWTNLAVTQEPPQRPAPPRVPEGVQVLRDLAYVEGGHERNRLDLYLPQKAEGRLPLIVWIHGGAWMTGSKEGCPAVWFSTRGYAVASINYRLSQHAVFPAQIEDCKAAIRWLRANAAKYHLDPDHVGVWGASAGGHLVAMLGTSGGVKELEGQGGNLDQSSRVQCVVDWFGPTDLVTMAGGHNNPDSPESRLIGGPVQENQEKARKASPLTYVSKDSAPFLIMHGDQDKVVPPQQSRVLAEALKKAGVEVKLQMVEGNGHGGPGFSCPENRKLVEDFFAKHLRSGSPAGGANLPPSQKRHVPFTISKETTYITEPLREDGYVDYVAALNQRFRAGVTPENNAAVPWLKAMGPGEIEPKYRDEYCRMLGVPPIPEKGDYYVDFATYAKGLKDSEKPAAQAGKREPDVCCDQLFQAMERPWSKKEFPVLAGWVAANERPLALVVAASRCSRLYGPLVSADCADNAAIAVLLPLVEQYRPVARVLIARAMLRLHENEVDGAWENLLACHRLAKLLGQGSTLPDELIAVALDRAASAGDQALLQHARLTPAQIARMRADLDQLPSTLKMVERINFAERLMYLDCIAMVARKGFSSLAGLAYDYDSQSKSMVQYLVDMPSGTAVDWDQAFRMGNSWYDRLVDVYRKPTFAEREAAAHKIDDDVQKLALAAKDWKSSGQSPSAGRRNTLSERVGQVFACVLLPGMTIAGRIDDEGTMQSELTRLLFALAAYHADRGVYPAKLADLTPKYVPEIPKDIFNASDLHYRSDGGGYLLYSVGLNGKDDGGKGFDDRKNGEDWDDMVVRMPPATPQK